MEEVYKYNDKDLFLKAKNGDEEAREKIIESNLWVVHKIVKSFLKNKNIDSKLYDDLVQAGSIGLIVAYENYDIESNQAFSDYAVMTILHNVYSSMFNNNGVKLDRNNNLKLLKIRRVISDYMNKNNGNVPSANYIVEKTGYSLVVVERLLRYLNDFVSLDECIEAMDDEEIDAFFYEDLNHEFERVELREYVDRIMMFSKLTDNEMTVIKSMYGLDGIVYNLNELSNMLGLSKQRIAIIHLHALKKIKETISDVYVDSGLRYVLDKLDLDDFDKYIIFAKLYKKGLTKKDIQRRFGYEGIDMKIILRKVRIHLIYALQDINKKELALGVSNGRRFY